MSTASCRQDGLIVLANETGLIIDKSAELQTRSESMLDSFTGRVD